MRRLLRCSTLFCILFLGCSKIDPKIEVPSYIEIDNYNVVTDTTTQGTTDQVFSNVLVFTPTQNLGYYPLPAKIPVLKSGNTQLMIRPVILVNGVTFLRVDYPVMANFDSVFPLKEGEALKVRPTFRYTSSASFPVLENFDKTNVTLINSDPNDTVTAKTDHTQSPHGKCLSMHLDANHGSSQVQSTTGFTVSTTGANTYVELNYKGNMDLEVGVIGSDSPGQIINPEKRSPGGARATDAWKKLYINLSEIIRYPPVHSYYYLYFSISQSTNAGQANPQVYIDDIKVVRQ